MCFFEGITPARLGQAGDGEGEADHLQSETDPPPPAIDFSGQGGKQTRRNEVMQALRAATFCPEEEKHTNGHDKESPKPFWRAEIHIQQLRFRNLVSQSRFLMAAFSRSSEREGVARRAIRNHS